MPEVRVIEGDSRDVLKTLGDATVDSVVTDPPYALVSIGKRFGAENAAPAKGDVYARASAGFMGQQWDTGETAFAVEFWREVYRVLKPGGHVIAFAGTRTYHRLACAVEDAGFEIRDMISWLYGSGFPKSHDVSKGIDKSKGVAFEASPAGGVGFMGPDGPGGYNVTKNQLTRVGEQSPEAARWAGWGTALKPACEPCVLARKPLSGTVAANVLEYGTGALNIDGCRIGEREARELNRGGSIGYGGSEPQGVVVDGGAGRWPANVIHDGSPEVVEAFPDSEFAGHHPAKRNGASMWSGDGGGLNGNSGPEKKMELGSAARFFYTAKADATDRLGTKHPTVKPTDLMRYMIRLVTPPGGLVLDPFAGSGSTGVAAVFEGMGAILVEREPAFAADARRRIEWAKGNGKLTALEKKQPKPTPADSINRGLFD